MNKILKTCLRTSALLLIALSLRATAEPSIEPLAHWPTGTVTIHGHHPDRQFDVWVAATDLRREQGLMFVKDLSAHQGMLFLFEQPDQLNFWMKNTYISLDIIYVSADHRVVRIAANAKPFSLEPIPSGALANGVLEIGGGLAHSLDIDIGDRIDYHLKPTH
jgi:uncharacterized membrane protein (UPF0127 family)